LGSRGRQLLATIAIIRRPRWLTEVRALRKRTLFARNIATDTSRAAQLR
jgi:hypothetical protein